MIDLTVRLVIVSAIAGLILWPLVAVLLRALRTGSRAAIAINLFAALLPILIALVWTGTLPVAVKSPIHLPLSRDTVVGSARTETNNPAAAETRRDTLMPGQAISPADSRGRLRATFVVIFLAGWVVSLSGRTVAWLRPIRSVRGDAAGAPSCISSITEESARALGLRRIPRLSVGDSERTPLLAGFLRPTIVLPAEATTWSEAETRFVMLHELAHVKHCDYLFVAMHALLVSPLYYHPFAIWLARELRFAVERAADETVVRHTRERSGYARFLLRLAAQGHRTAVAPLAIRGLTGRRINSITSSGGTAMPQRIRNLISLALTIIAATTMLWLAAPGTIAQSLPTMGPSHESTSQVARSVQEPVTRDYEFVSRKLHTYGVVTRFTVESAGTSVSYPDVVVIWIGEPILKARFFAPATANPDDLPVRVEPDSGVVLAPGDIGRDPGGVWLVLELAPDGTTARYMVVYGWADSATAHAFVEEMQSVGTARFASNIETIRFPGNFSTGSVRSTGSAATAVTAFRGSGFNPEGTIGSSTESVTVRFGEPGNSR